MVRLKNRYLLVNILYPELEKGQVNSKLPDVIVFNQPTASALNVQALLRSIRSEVSTLFGDFGSGAVSDSLSVKYLSTATSTFILRVTRAHYKIVWAALSSMNRIPIKDGKKCVFQVVRVSGTMKKAEQEAIRRAREILLQARRDVEQHGSSTLDSIFKHGDTKETSRDVLMVDRSDSEEDDLSDGSD